MKKLTLILAIISLNACSGDGESDKKPLIDINGEWVLTESDQDNLCDRLQPYQSQVINITQDSDALIAITSPTDSFNAVGSVISENAIFEGDYTDSDGAYYSYEYRLLLVDGVFTGKSTWLRSNDAGSCTESYNVHMSCNSGACGVEI